jgi:hypothetical protein
MVGSIFAMPVNVIATETVPEGMVSYWRFDEGSGRTAEESVTGYDGALQPGGPAWTTGKIDGALSFDGSDDYVEFSAEDMPTGERTVGLWFYTADQIPNRQLFGYGGNSNVPQHSSFLIDFPSADKTQIRVHRHYSGGEVFTYTAGSPMTNAWYHLAFTTDSSGSKLYINGQLVVSNDVVISTYVLGKDGFIGAITDGSGVGPFVHPSYPIFSGLIDEVAIHNRALTSSEIQLQYNNGLYGIEITPDDNTVGLWHLDVGTGLTALDSSVNDNDGVLKPAPSGPQWTSGQVGGALSFDGSDDYVEFSAEDMPTGERTVELWFYTTDQIPNRQLFGYGGNSNVPQHSSFLIDFPSGDKTQIRVHRHYSGGEVFTYTAGSPMTNAWYHLAFTTDSSGSKLYINGQLVVSNNVVISTYVSGKDGFIGAITDGSGIGPFVHPSYPIFSGLIDEVAIWSRALTPDVILLHYTNGLIGEGYTYVPPDQAIQNLFDDIQNEELSQGAETSLLAKLDAALESLENGEDQEAMNILNAFKNAVEAQRGKKLTDAQATALIEAADDILDTIGGN